PFYLVNQQDLEIRYGKEEERKKKIAKIDKREKEEQRLRRIQIENEEDKKFFTSIT
ncbi:16766_t:CDS:1, partial [Gigaspora margarita]